MIKFNPLFVSPTFPPNDSVRSLQTSGIITVPFGTEYVSPHKSQHPLLRGSILEDRREYLSKEFSAVPSVLGEVH